MEFDILVYLSIVYMLKRVKNDIIISIKMAAIHTTTRCSLRWENQFCLLQSVFIEIG